MRFHVCGLWHVPTHKDYNACAFSMHIDRMCTGLTSRGHEVYHYGHPGSETDCTEHIDVIGVKLSKSIVQTNHSNTYDYSYNNATHVFQTALCGEIIKRIEPGDYVLINFGAYSEYVINAMESLSDLPVFVVENTIGYIGAWQSPYKVFESNSVRDWTRSEWNKNWRQLNEEGHEGEYPKWAVHECTPQWTDDTIPTFVVPELFDYIEEKEDYFLYLGRIIASKGIDLAIDTCGKIGAKLIVAGQTPQGVSLSDVLGYDPPSFVKFVGHADMDTRRVLMSKAKGVSHVHIIQSMVGMLRMNLV